MICKVEIRKKLLLHWNHNNGIPAKFVRLRNTDNSKIHSFLPYIALRCVICLIKKNRA